jgi:hypothetical protein
MRRGREEKRGGMISFFAAQGTNATVMKDLASIKKLSTREDSDSNNGLNGEYLP